MAEIEASPKIVKGDKEPVYRQIRNHLLGRIEQGHWRRGGKIDTIEQLVKTFKVHPMTVRQAVGELVKEGILQTRRGSGTYISEEVVKGQRTVAVVWGHRHEFAPRSPWHPRVYHKVCSYLEELGCFARTYTLFHVSEKLDEAAMTNLEADARARKFAGFISFPEFRYLKPGFREQLDDLGIRHLNFDFIAPTNAVIADYFVFGSMAAKYLYERGVRKMGLIGVEFLPADRFEPDYSGLMSARCEYPEIVVSDAWVHRVGASISRGRELIKQIWSARERPEGLIISDEVTFLGVVMGMLELGIRYPEDLQLVVQSSTGEEDKCVYSPARLDFCPEQVATHAVDSLLRMIRDGVRTVSTVRFAPILIPEGEAEVREPRAGRIDD